MEDHQTNGYFEFASFHFDADNFHLTWKGETIPLTPREFSVLLLLVENAGKVVTKDELLRTIWKDTFVEEATLTRNISWLRKKLRVNGANDTKIIETIPKRGYRFLPRVKKSIQSISNIEEEKTQPAQTQYISEKVPIADAPHLPRKDEPVEINPPLASGLFHNTLVDSRQGVNISVLGLFTGLLILAVLILFAYSLNF